MSSEINSSVSRQAVPLPMAMTFRLWRVARSCSFAFASSRLAAAAAPGTGAGGAAGVSGAGAVASVVGIAAAVSVDGAAADSVVGIGASVIGALVSAEGLSVADCDGAALSARGTAGSGVGVVVSAKAMAGDAAAVTSPDVDGTAAAVSAG